MPSRGKQRWPMPQQFYELKKVFNPVIAKKALMEAYPVASSPVVIEIPM